MHKNSLKFDSWGIVYTRYNWFLISFIAYIQINNLEHTPSMSLTVSKGEMLSNVPPSGRLMITVHVKVNGFLWWMVVKQELCQANPLKAVEVSIVPW